MATVPSAFRALEADGLIDRVYARIVALADEESQTNDAILDVCDQQIDRTMHLLMIENITVPEIPYMIGSVMFHLGYETALQHLSERKPD